MNDPTPIKPPRPFQERVHAWVVECFGRAIGADKEERLHRFIEEALELVQAGGCPRKDVLQLVQYVYSRPSGTMAQEVGGVAVTLAALCTAFNINLTYSSEHELERVWSKIQQIRAKQAAKPTRSPLPIATQQAVCRFDAQTGECNWTACPNNVPGFPTSCPLPWPRKEGEP